MKPVIHKQRSLAVAYDAGLVDVPEVEFFSAEVWESRRALVGHALGRGNAWFIDAPFGPAVLRQYYRGGWVAAISRERYFFTTVSRSRSFREFHLLAALYKKGLPVPRPVAALCEHRGVLSTGAIMTMRIASSHTLADILPGNPDGPDLTPADWNGVGKCIRQFHDCGVWHADLNARNILIDDDLQVFLIDFDRSHFSPGKAVNGKRNLERLKRSLTKLWPKHTLSMMPAAWDDLRRGYHG